MQINVLFVVRRNAVAGYDCVSKAPFVVFVYQETFIFLVFFGQKLFGAKQIGKLINLVGLLHCLLEFLYVSLLYAGKVNVFYLNLFVSVDVYINYNLFAADMSSCCNISTLAF